jgi:hypothetical protein
LPDGFSRFTITAMAVLSLLVATLVPMAVAIVVAIWNWSIQRTFFEALVASRGHAPREPAPFKIGLGLDEMMVSWRDGRPAQRVMSQPIDDAALELGRRRAVLAERVAYASVPAVVVIGLVMTALLSTFWVFPVVGGIGVCAFGLSDASGPGIWYSRPEVGPVSGLLWVYYLVPGAIVAGTLLIAGLLIAIVNEIRG